MVKAKLLMATFCITALLGISGCKQPAGNTPSQENPPVVTSKVIDFRNKDSYGKVIAARSVLRAAEDSALEQKFEEVQEITTLGGLTEEDISQIITFEDSENGLKVFYKTPESMRGSYSPVFNMVLVDSNGNWSTQMNNRWSKICAGEDGIIFDEFSFEYPLVIAGKKTSFWFQPTYKDPLTKEIKAEFQWRVSVTPKHGTGMVDPLPENFDSFSNEKASYKDGRFTFTNVIPPVGETVVKSIYVYVLKDKNEPWKFRPYGELNDYDIDYGQSTDFYLGDLVKTTDEDIDFKEWPYFIVFMKYYYTVKGWDDIRFSTPVIYSPCYENDGFFGKPLSERSVSTTEMIDVVENNVKGKKITFSGNGVYDGLYESSELVDYLGKEIKPAVFVSGLDAYVLDVSSEKYLLVEKTSLKDFYLKGHSFTDDGKVSFKYGDKSVKINKSNKTEIFLPSILNAKDVELKMDGHILKWVTKPEIEGDASGIIGINFFPDFSYQWMGKAEMPYGELKDIDLSQVDWACFSEFTASTKIPFIEFRKNKSFVISVNYNGFEFPIKKQVIAYDVPEPKITLDLNDFDFDNDGKIILTEGGEENKLWRHLNMSLPESVTSLEKLKKGDLVRVDFNFKANSDTNLVLKFFRTDFVNVSSNLSFWNEQENGVKAGQVYQGSYEFILKEDLSEYNVNDIIFHIAGSYNKEGTTIVLDLQ